ncbi:MAG: hypothetical protein AAFN11_05460 [Chloroflexota bacterium]
MAFMNKAERDALLDDIKDKNFNRIRNTIYRKDKKARLAYFRNVQESGMWMTRYIMEGAGAQVTVYEDIEEEQKEGFSKRTYNITQIVVEPTADNRLD